MMLMRRGKYIKYFATNNQQLSMNETLLYTLIVVNIVTFLIYGIDKWKAKRSKYIIYTA